MVVVRRSPCAPTYSYSSYLPLIDPVTYVSDVNSALLSESLVIATWLLTMQMEELAYVYGG
jgi:hypothetical protein